MASIVYLILCAILIPLQLRTANLFFVNGQTTPSCKLENRTYTLPICKRSPTFTIPVCVGHCSSGTRWDFKLNRFLSRTTACTVTAFKTINYTCLDSTHTAITIIIPLACSCGKPHCLNAHPHHPL